MGWTHVTARLTALTGRRKAYQGEFLVDTGAIDSMAPRERLKRAGIKPEGKRVYELADGTAIEHEYGFARIAFLGETTVTPVIFGPPGCEPLLGVLALEGMGISVDPVTRTFHRLHAKPLKAWVGRV
ncbi:MAG: aspartyl protease family protein [Planctomycetes bacterium]|nr:aspartyl protease family protein [Planctomycetota bacterium]